MKEINKKGFTLIELLVVIAIIGMLSTIITVAANQAKRSANDARRMADINSLQRAIELGYVDDRNYNTVLGAGCSTAGSRVSQCDGDSLVLNMPAISNLGEISGNTLGCTTMEDSCDYSVLDNPTANTYRIGFWLQGGLAGLGEGAHYLTQDGIY